jgi:hypothetical protein
MIRPAISACIGKIGNILLQSADGDVRATLSLAAPTVTLEPLSIVARVTPPVLGAAFRAGSGINRQPASLIE